MFFLKLGLKIFSVFILVIIGMSIVDVVLNHGRINMVKNIGFSIGISFVYYWKARKILKQAQKETENKTDI